LFADFNGLPDEFDQRIDFYQHEGHWSNRMILGDSLLVMTSLAEKEGLKGKVQTIYLDPPYGIKFGSNWQVSTRKRDVKDGKAEDATRQPEQVRAFRDTWELGVHSYLAYLRDRLVLARELLTEGGSLFVQIGDQNVHVVRCLMDEVFGSDNFIAEITFKTSIGLGAEYIDRVSDHIIWFAKQRELLKYRPLYLELVRGEKGATRYNYAEMPDGSVKSIGSLSNNESDGLPEGTRFFTDQGLTSRRTGTVEERYTFEFEGKKYRTTAGTWRTTRQGMERLVSANRILATASQIRYKKYFDDFGALSLTNFWEDVGGGIQSRSDPKIYVVQTNTSIIERCLLMTTDPGDLVLDPTCGSGTTAYVAEQWGRRWITIDTSRVALALARTRLMAAKFPYYYLADDYPNWTQHVADDELKKYLRKNAPASDPKSGPDIRKGMVYKRVPHVTLKSIANNPDITEGMTREAIDAAIARHADTETLFDKPYEDNKRLRVSGPFTVESLSPHRTISVADKKERSEVGKGGLKIQVIGPDDFGTMILDNLRKAGIQNTIKNERLKFDTLDPYPGEWIHGRGTFTEQPSSPRPAAGRGAGGEGLQKSVAICIGPEYGTVGPALVKEAAKEAVKGVGFDLLVVCGFAFDPHVSEEAKRYGKLTVLPARMNPDLAMGDELLKKTGAGNLFMIFGEPDVEIRNVGQASSLPDSKLKGRAGKMPTPRGDQFVVEIKGLDVYDPTTGEIRNSSTDDIACWFIDTDYNDESFFVRHAYFTGADEPYAKLQRALRAEIDEAAWSSLYSTTSRPIDKPESGKIAVKVINHYGDEVMKVFDV
jgi:adenine-specific DNA-methyltransferase